MSYVFYNPETMQNPGTTLTYVRPLDNTDKGNIYMNELGHIYYDSGVCFDGERHILTLIEKINDDYVMIDETDYPTEEELGEYYELVERR